MTAHFRHVPARLRVDANVCGLACGYAAITAASKIQKKENSLLISLLIAKNRETRAAEIAPLRKRLKRRNYRAKENPQIKNLKITT